MTYSTTPLKGKSVRDLEFLTGHWKGMMGDDIVEEYWLPEMYSNKACVFRWIKKGMIYIYEIVSLVEREGEIHMLLRHFDKAFAAWEEKDNPRDFVVTELSEKEVVFIDTQNPDGGFLRYDASKKDTLEFFDHEPDGTINFILLFNKV
ncbi:hypothetical protein EU528_08885 [Candidatus Thorarchaeota archaeon]|nr:MAG: hypothetical protein EU528_08885 [Candidatus Thorarchaeota archaeon]